MEQHIVMLFKGYNIFGNIKAYRLLSIDIGQENTKGSDQIEMKIFSMTALPLTHA